MRFVMAVACVFPALAIAQRDPFEPTWRPPKAPPAATCRTTLCRLGLSEVKLVATVTGTSRPVAMFEDRRGIGYFAQRGAWVGPASRITDISGTCVTITTFTSMSTGRREASTSKVCLPEQAVAAADLAQDR
ncbi:MAG: hypothetical protein SFW67_20525 [Myxococcaceae bacterium]|nr:hypothetical protein [Myxococcaceae bacterium]